MNNTTMYYLWKDKISTPDKLRFYVTNYKEIREDGKVKVDGFGYVEAELVISSKVKTDLYTYAQQLM